jgi:hypothetical protein
MMRKIKAELTALCKVAQEDIKKFISWVWANRGKNFFDMRVITYPRTCMARAYDEEQTLCLVPVSPILMLESIAPKPDLTDRQRVLCLYRITEVVEQTMKDTGFMECYFLASPDDPLAEVAINHGWQEVKGFRVLKRRADPLTYPISESLNRGEQHVYCNED